jgi:signal peptidase I
MLIDDHTFQLLKTSIQKAGWLELPSFGNSMYPFIRQGNVCRFVPCEIDQIKKGDVLLFYSLTGQLIAHRLVSVKTKNKKLLFQLKGDTNLGFDQLIEEDRILGKLINIQKQSKTLNPEHGMARLWGKIILSFPVLSAILQKYLNRKLQF